MKYFLAGLLFGAFLAHPVSVTGGEAFTILPLAQEIRLKSDARYCLKGDEKICFLARERRYGTEPTLTLILQTPFVTQTIGGLERNLERAVCLYSTPGEGQISTLTIFEGVHWSEHYTLTIRCDRNRQWFTVRARQDRVLRR